MIVSTLTNHGHVCSRVDLELLSVVVEIEADSPWLSFPFGCHNVKECYIFSRYVSNGSVTPANAPEVSFLGAAVTDGLLCSRLLVCRSSISPVILSQIPNFCSIIFCSTCLFLISTCPLRVFNSSLIFPGADFCWALASWQWVHFQCQILWLLPDFVLISCNGLFSVVLWKQITTQ